VTNPGNQSSTVNTAIGPVQLSASGGTPPYAWSATGLPPGLTVSAAGSITGTPTKTGSYTVTVTATDSSNATGSASFGWSVRKKHGR
jgi:serine protease